MKYWGNKTNKSFSSEEYDISEIDQAIFDDPVKLLEYLKKKEKSNQENDNSSDRTLYISSNERNETHYSQVQTLQRYGNKRQAALYGYEKINGQLQIVPEEAHAIIAILKCYDSGLNFSQIQYRLSNTQFTTTNGKKFYPAAIKAIVENRKIYEGKTGYPPIINERTNTTNHNLRQNTISTTGIMARRETNFENKSQVPGKTISTANTQDIRHISHKDIQKSREILDENNFKKVEDFISFIKPKGAVIVDNRWKDGCLWVLSEPTIDKIMQNVKIKGRQFKLTTKSKALEGKPGWYY